MALLIRRRAVRRALVLVLFLGCAAPASAGLLPVVQTLDFTTGDSFGGGPVYNLGASLVAGLGRADDPTNRSGDFHFTYSRQYSVDDPTSSASLKHVNNYAGGIGAAPFGDAFLGVDFDEASDRYEMFLTNGAKATVGYGPFRLSFRYASTTLQQTLTLPSTKVTVDGNGKTTITSIATQFAGAEIYQETLGLQANLDPGPHDSLSLSIEGSRFGPPAPSFAYAIQNLGNLAGLSTYADSLQSLEQYAYDALWKHVFNESGFDSKVETRFSHEVITANTLTDLQLAGGLRLSRAFHVQVGWEYTHDLTQTQNLLTLEVRASWDREGAPANEADQGLFNGLPRSRVRGMRRDGQKQQQPETSDDQ